MALLTWRQHNSKMFTRLELKFEKDKSEANL